VAPLLLRESGALERPRFRASAGLGGRVTPTPSEYGTRFDTGDRLLLVSDGVVHAGAGQAGLGEDGLARAARAADPASASSLVREVHRAVLAASGGELTDDATAVCLLAG
jgi:hypothetical protein